MSSKDPKAASRKQDHISLAMDSIVSGQDERFYYEPVISGFPNNDKHIPISVVGKSLQYPLWISSMTGGTELAKTINQNLARAAQEYGLGMGLGSCRQLLESDERLPDFAIRNLMPDQPLIANLGVAQVEELILSNQLDKIKSLVSKLEVDGLFIHINPLQEWMQPEGDRYSLSPLQCIEALLELNIPLFVKEVGQGMGPKSLEALLKLPLEAIEFGAHGGTNFSLLELLRSSKERQDFYTPVTKLGHSVSEMITLTNHLVAQLGTQVKTKNIIASGGIRSFVDGYYCINKLTLPSLYAQASPFLKYAQGDYDTLREFVETQIEGLRMCQAFLTVK